MLSALLLAATATAQLTTSVRFPAGPPDAAAMDYLFAGSVVAVDGDKTTMAMAMTFDGDDEGIEWSGGMTETVTFDGSTWMETQYTTSMEAKDDYSYSFGCNMPANTRESLTCTYSENGPFIVSTYCESLSSYYGDSTQTYLYTYSSDEFSPGTVETVIETYDFGSSEIPDYCTNGGSIFPESMAIQTIELSGTNARYIDVVVTAGQEKLGASAGATPTSSGARSTATDGTVFTTFISSTGQNGSPTGPTDVPAAPENTNAAAPMVTLAPALAGLGVAMAAFVL